MSGEVSYFSRFFVKFVEIIAAGLASAICAYLLAHFGGVLLTSATPAPAPVTPTASLLADSVRAQPIPLLAVAPVNERRAVPQKDIDAPAVQPAANAGKEAKTLPLRKHAKTATSVAEKGPRGQKSVEVLTRAALANIDADRPPPVDAPIGPKDGAVLGDQYTFIALASSAKAIVAYHTGKRDSGNTDLFIQDLRQRVLGLPAARWLGSGVHSGQVVGGVGHDSSSMPIVIAPYM